MATYEYRVVPFMGKIKSGQAADDVSRQLQEVIAKNSSGGWEFYQLADVDIEVQPGCLSALFGAKVAYSTYNQVIFRKAT